MRDGLDKSRVWPYRTSELRVCATSIARFRFCRSQESPPNQLATLPASIHTQNFDPSNAITLPFDLRTDADAAARVKDAGEI
jgi:hypothetical protein